MNQSAMAGNGTGNAVTKLPICPERIPETWLSPSSHPSVFCTTNELTQARKVIKETAWGREYLANRRKLCASFQTGHSTRQAVRHDEMQGTEEC